MTNPRVTSFPALIRWIADKYHDGAVLPIAAKIRISPALVHLWVTGSTRNPKIENLERLCDAYSLDFDFVRGLLRRPPISGGSANDPPHFPVDIIPEKADFPLFLLLYGMPLLRRCAAAWSTPCTPLLLAA